MPFCGKSYRLAITLLTQLSLLLSAASATWQLQSSGLPPSLEFANAIDACSDSLVIFGAGIREGKRLYISSNCGNDWMEIQIEGDSSRFITDVSMVDRNNIWVVTAYPAKIYSSSNGGESWSLQYHEATITEFFDYIEMFDSTQGIAMGDGIGIGIEFPAVLLRTTDGGTSWMSINDTLGSYSGGSLWACIDFTNINDGFWRPAGCPPEMQRVHRTRDSGNSWVLVDPGTGVHLLKFYDSNIGLTSNYDTACRTINGGESWTIFPKPHAYTYDLEFSPSNPAYVWMLNGESVLFSSDTGHTWEAQLTGLSNATDIVFVSSEVGWVLDYDGIYHTTNGGTVGVQQERSLLANGIHNYHIYPNPVNGHATIQFTLNNPSSVSLKVYDILGAIIYDEGLSVTSVGEHLIGWQSARLDGSELSSGLYFVSLVTQQSTVTRKILIIR